MYKSKLTMYITTKFKTKKNIYNKISYCTPEQNYKLKWKST